MREIKFRGKAKFSGTIGSDKWIYSSLMRLDAPTHRLNLAGQDCELETLGQFTGLHDKNGKEIYEGDVLSQGEARFIVKWDDSHAMFKCYFENQEEHYCNLNDSYIHEFFEVIGNINEDSR